MPLIWLKINLSYTHSDDHVIDWIDDEVNRVEMELNEFETKNQLKSEPNKISLVSSGLFARMDIIILFTIGHIHVYIIMVFGKNIYYANGFISQIKIT